MFNPSVRRTSRARRSNPEGEWFTVYKLPLADDSDAINTVQDFKRKAELLGAVRWERGGAESPLDALRKRAKAWPYLAPAYLGARTVVWERVEKTLVGFLEDEDERTVGALVPATGGEEMEGIGRCPRCADADPRLWDEAEDGEGVDADHGECLECGYTWDPRREDIETSRGPGAIRKKNPAAKRARARAASAPKPSGALVELGRLTELEWEEPGTRKLAVARWAFATAPILAEDKRRRLFVVYGASPAGKSGTSERVRYRVTHWGRAPRGVQVAGAVLQGPHAVVLGTGTRIVYTTQKGRDGAPVDYVHAWGEGAPRGTKWQAPVVVAQAQSGTGRRIVALVGGTYRVTARGIVG